MSFRILALAILSLAWTAHGRASKMPHFGIVKGHAVRASAAFVQKIRGGGMFSKTGSTDGDAVAAKAAGTGTVYPPMTQEEVEAVLDDVPIYSVTDPSGQGVVLKNPTTGASIFYFYVSPGMANATVAELKKTNPSMDLRVTAYRLGQVYFKILKNNTATDTAVKLVGSEDKVDDVATASAVDYRLVPDTRDLIGARMLLTMTSKDGEELQKSGKMTDEIAQKAIKRAMTESKKFNSTYNEVPVFLIQQMRVQAKPSSGDKKGKQVQLLPMYMSLSDMVGVWQEFAAVDPKAKAAEPAIHLMDLDELVTNMLAGGEVDFRSIVLIGATGKDPKKPVAPGSAPDSVIGGKTLGDL